MLERVIGVVEVCIKRTTPRFSVASRRDLFGHINVYGGTEISQLTGGVIKDEADGRRMKFNANGDLPIYEGHRVEICYYHGLPYYFKNYTLGESGYISDGMHAVGQRHRVLPRAGVFYPFSIISFILAFLFGSIVSFASDRIFDLSHSTISSIQTYSFWFGFVAVSLLYLKKCIDQEDRQSKILQQLFSFAKS